MKKIRMVLFICWIAILFVTRVPASEIEQEITRGRQLISVGVGITDSQSASALKWAIDVDMYMLSHECDVLSGSIHEFCEDISFYKNIDTFNNRNKILGYLDSVVSSLEGHETIEIGTVISTGCTLPSYKSPAAYRWLADVVRINARYPNSSVYSRLKSLVLSMEQSGSVDSSNDHNMAIACLMTLSEELENGTYVCAHRWEQILYTAPTCTIGGYKVLKCYICNDTNTETIAPKGHGTGVLKFVKTVTCTKDGYTGDLYCPDCGVLLKEGTTIEAVGHQWDNGHITKMPSSTEEGERSFMCTVCGETKTEIIPRIDQENVMFFWLMIILLQTWESVRKMW